MMTRLRAVSSSGEKVQGCDGATLPPLAPRSLTADLVERLTTEIVSGRLAPGSRLPTEQEMVRANGVSRTVIREAVAVLRADGLVSVRQGVGAFVADTVRRPFRIDVDKLDSLRQALAVMELRTGIEIEAAGLAAERAGSAQIRMIEQAYVAIDRALARGEFAIDEDYAFHVNIAQATGNAQFLGFLQYLGHSIIPRSTVRVGAPTLSNNRSYLKKVQREHREILQAIRAGSPARARAAMRRHLLNSRKRYQKEQSRMLGDER
jgi:GntR family transcriptional regulator, transcriptional repressor for pyruvate dehydrogenase complex